VQSDLVIRAARAVIDGREVAATVSVSNGRIVAIDSLDAGVSATTVVELGPGEVLLRHAAQQHSADGRC
jgi:allantoinase